MAQRAHRESTWPRRATTAESSDRPESRIDANSGGRSIHNGTTTSASDTIFDFQLPDVTRQEVDDLHRRAEYLLDEMEMGAADRAAEGAPLERDGDGYANVSPSDNANQTNGNGHTHSSEHSNGNGRTNGYANGSYASDSSANEYQDRPQSVQPDPPSLTRHDGNATGSRSRVLPEAALPSIRSRPSPPAPRTATPDTQPTAPQKTVSSTGGMRVSVPTATTSDRLPTAASVLDAPVSAPRRIAARPTPVVSVSETKARELEEEIDQLYNQVNRLQQSRRELTGHALSLLRESRAILHTQPERYGRAEYNVRQVRIILDRARDGRRRSLRYGVLLLVYLALWLTVCASAITSLFLYGRDVQIILEAALGGDSRLAANTVSVLWAVLGGAAGGVLGAIASLATHLRQGQEFDRQYVLRYTIQPIMGVVLALFIYLLCSFFANALEADLTAGQMSSLLPAAIAFPAGLWQEMVYALLYRLTGVFRFGSRRR